MDRKVFYITKEKFKELQKEHDVLIDIERKKVMGEDAPKVLESEDLNPEFVSFQEDMDALRTRIEELKNIFDHHEMITKPPKKQQSFVNLGATIKVDIGGKPEEITLVGTLEANPDMGKISNESPIGKALLGRRVGDEVIIPSPVKAKYKVKGIKYELG